MMAMLNSLILLFIIFSVGNAEVGKCPYGWINFGLRCFKYFPRSVTWITAEKNCQIHGANLASVHSKPENDFVQSLLPSPSIEIWIGGHDGEKDGQWLWSDGRVNDDFTNWCSGEPNNYEGGPENCLEMNWSSNHCWNDASCSLSKNYVCVADV